MRQTKLSVAAMVCLFAVLESSGFGQKDEIAPDLGKIAAKQGWSLHDTTAESATVEGKSGVRLKARADSITGVAGLVLAEGVEFTTGSIEVDLKGRDVRPSFLGIAFNVADERTFEAVYFRPFNFKADGDYRRRAVQYVAWPMHKWDELRHNQPGTFESAVSSVPDPNRWFHARIEVNTRTVRVFVNKEKNPSLTVSRLEQSAKGRRMGLFVDSGDGLYANLKVNRSK